MLPVGGVAAVDRAHRPLVGIRARRDVSAGQHRLDRQNHAGLEARLNAAHVVVQNVRRHVHLGADAVSDELLDDAGFPAVDEGVLRDDGLNRLADGADALAGREAGEGGPQRFACHRVELAPLAQRRLVDAGDRARRAGAGGEVGVLNEGLADDHAERRVAVPLLTAAFDEGAAVEGDDVTRGQLVVVGDTVDDDVVDGDAHRRRVAVVAEEIRRGTAVGDSLGAHLVQLARRDAGRTAERSASWMEATTSPASRIQRSCSTDLSSMWGIAYFATESRIAKIRSVTSSMEPRPSTTSSRS